jgi:radical SAM protein with 4Fe4S-binding SPASM domain
MKVMEMVLPVDIRWEITNKCNYACLHCYNDSGAALDDELTLEEVVSILDDLETLSVVVDVCFEGGEPFSRHDLMEILHHTYSKFKTGVITNGSLLTEEKVDQLQGRVDYISVSLDASTPETYTYVHGMKDHQLWRRVLDNVELLVRKNIPVSISMVINRRNSGEVTEFLGLARTLQVNQVFFSIFKPMGRGRLYRDELFFPLDEYNALMVDILDRKKDFDFRIGFEKYCYAWLYDDELLRDAQLICSNFPGTERITHECAHSITILSNGAVVPCSVLREFVCGNLRNDSLADIFNNSSTYGYLRGLEMPEQCAGCSYLTYCRGGCLGNRISYTGGMSALDPLCPCCNESLKVIPVRSPFVCGKELQAEKGKVEGNITIVKRDIKIIERKEEFGTILFNAETGRVFSLGGIALDIWHFISQKETVSFREIMGYVKSEFSGLPEEEKLQWDILGFVEMLEENGLVKRVFDSC